MPGLGTEGWILPSYLAFAGFIPVLTKKWERKMGHMGKKKGCKVVKSQLLCRRGLSRGSARGDGAEILIIIHYLMEQHLSGLG